MSFNRRGDRRPDHRSDRSDRPDRDRHDRPPQRQGDWRPREYPRGDRPYQGRGGSERPYPQRPRYERAPDEGGMSIRLDPRRVGTLKQLAADAGMRPGDLVRLWVEERIDAERRGDQVGAAGGTLAARIDDLTARVAALEGLSEGPAPAEQAQGTEPAEPEAAEPSQPGAAAVDASPTPARRGRPRKSASAAPARRVPLHEEMIAVITERGPMTAAHLAAAIVERGRYSPPRSGKPLDAAMVSQRVSNPTYRARFTRRDGRIGLASEEAGEPAES